MRVDRMSTEKPPRPSVGRFARCRRGAAAIEFAVAAPVLCAALLAMVDAALAARERLALGHVVRSGAHAAMEGDEAARVLEVMRAVAGADADRFVLDAARVCACPESPEMATSCGATCEGDAPTSIFHDLAARGTFDGLISPAFDLAAVARVQVR